VMEFEFTQSNTTSKLPILKLGEYEMWVIIIKQYFQVQDYALWEVIENVPVQAEEKTNKKNDVKARSLLLMALPNEHQLTFSQYIWMNKADIETMSIDDLYNNFKIVEQDVKKSVGATDLEQIHEDDLEVMDLKWQLSCKIGHFARECRAPRNKEGQFRNQDNTRKQGNNEDTSSKAMMAIKWVNYNYTTNRTHPNAQRNMVPRAVLMKTGLKSFNTARTVNTAQNPNLQFKVNHANEEYKALSIGCSRHMIGNIAYLSDFKEFNGGYVTFGGGAHGGRISSKGTLKTDSLDFEDVYFVNELNFNLFSVSQMCDKKNYVLFTDTECLVLSPNFKLPDESQILLKIPRKDTCPVIN
ncbi:hypothetical protein Tco_0933585, partial [Tanacetum coccineum]